MANTITPQPAERRTPTKITLDHPVIIGDAVEAIMRLCGGDCFGFGYAYRPTPQGDIPLFSVYKTIKGERSDTCNTIYNIDPNVVCTEYMYSVSQEFTISSSANFPPEGVAAFERELANIKGTKLAKRR